MAELRWDSDADLDLEIWPDGDSPVSGRAPGHELAGGGPDVVDGTTGRCEWFEFAPPYDEAPRRLAVAFWAPGPSKDTTTTATLTLRGLDAPRTYTIDLSDDTSDLCIAIRLDARGRRTEDIHRLTHRAL